MQGSRIFTPDCPSAHFENFNARDVRKPKNWNAKGHAYDEARCRIADLMFLFTYATQKPDLNCSGPDEVYVWLTESFELDMFSIM